MNNNYNYFTCAILTTIYALVLFFNVSILQFGNESPTKMWWWIRVERQQYGTSHKSFSRWQSWQYSYDTSLEYLDVMTRKLTFRGRGTNDPKRSTWGLSVINTKYCDAQTTPKKLLVKLCDTACNTE